MEPMSCTADVRADRCDVWAPTQDPQDARIAASNESGLPISAVTVHVTLLGGGFGRRASHDFVVEAVQVSKAVGKPVKVVWTREDDIQHDFYRPASYHYLRASIGTDGLPQGDIHVVAGQSTGDAPTDGAGLGYAATSANAIDATTTNDVPVGIWRSVNYSNNIFAVESFLDEVAAAEKSDPYQLRLRLLDVNPRLKAVVTLAATKAGWGTPLPAGHGRGMAACTFRISNTCIAEVAQVSIDAAGAVRVHRVVCAVDCGLVINPSIAQAQVEGAVLFGLAAALKGEITLAGGRIQQSNFHDYPLLRMDETPSIEVYFVPSTDGPFGLGEPGVPPIAPAVANAIFAATGRRIRRLPIRPADLR
jgi:isoquinoline 1-oxidoreductase beta subunit